MNNLFHICLFFIHLIKSARTSTERLLCYAARDISEYTIDKTSSCLLKQSITFNACSIFVFVSISTITKGHERLVQALSDMYSKLINRKIDPFKEILITCGAYEALYSTIRGFVVEIRLYRIKIIYLCR